MNKLYKKKYLKNDIFQTKCLKKKFNKRCSTLPIIATAAGIIVIIVFLVVFRYCRFGGFMWGCHFLWITFKKRFKTFKTSSVNIRMSTVTFCLIQYNIMLYRQQFYISEYFNKSIIFHANYCVTHIWIFDFWFLIFNQNIQTCDRRAIEIDEGKIFQDDFIHRWS